LTCKIKFILDETLWHSQQTIMQHLIGANKEVTWSKVYVDQNQDKFKQTYTIRGPHSQVGSVYTNFKRFVKTLMELTLPSEGHHFDHSLMTAIEQQYLVKLVQGD
jgi:hypothetical protein